MTVLIDGTAGITNNSGTLISATTIGVGGTTPAASGAGITFPATQSASSDANTLDDYEEGTWTPTLGGTTTYTQQSGLYTKIGNFVYVTGKITVNTIGTGSTVLVSGLPFTASGTSGRTYAGYVAYFSAIATNIVTFYPRLNPGETSLQFDTATAAGSAPSPNAIFKNSAVVDFAIGYFA